MPRTWTEPTHPNPCNSTYTGRYLLGGGTVACTREAGHPANHVGPKRGGNGRALWLDWSEGATPHRKEQP